MGSRSFDYDVFVIGAGSGGVRAARVAASLGARVAIAEGDKIGGTCVIRGCIPKKIYVYSAEHANMFRNSKKFGWDYENSSFSWEKLVDAKRAEIDRLSSIYTGLLKHSGVDLYSSYALLSGSNNVKLHSGKTFSARHIILSTGSRPSELEFPGSHHLILSNDIFDLTRFPGRLLIMGGGYIACEFACIFANLGASVSLCLRGDRILRDYDGEMVGLLMNRIMESGVNILYNTSVTSITSSDNEVKNVSLRDVAGRCCSMQFDQVLCAVGRSPAVEGCIDVDCRLELDSSGHIIVDSCYQTSIPSVYAIGDLINRMKLTPLAVRQGECLVRYLLQDAPLPEIVSSEIPTAVFTNPEIASVGLTESQAVDFCDASSKACPLVYTSSFRSLKDVIAQSEDKIFMKMIVCRDSGKLLGLHMMGCGSSEIIQALAVAFRMGAKKEDFDNVICLHPTVAEEFITLRNARDASTL